MNEVWKDVVGYEGYYLVSNIGNVKSLNRNKLLSPCCDRGYKKVVLYKNSIKQKTGVHRLVAKAFIDNKNNYLEVNHIDENKSNNTVENLEWCNRKQNLQHSIDSGKLKVTRVKQYDLSGRFIKEYNSATQAERETNIPRTHICKCCLGRHGHKTAGGYIWKSKNNEDKNEYRQL